MGVCLPPREGIRLWWGIGEVMWGVVAYGVGVCLYPWKFNEWILARGWGLLLIAAEKSDAVLAWHM